MTKPFKIIQFVLLNFLFSILHAQPTQLGNTVDNYDYFLATDLMVLDSNDIYISYVKNTIPDTLIVRKKNGAQWDYLDPTNPHIDIETAWHKMFYDSSNDKLYVAYTKVGAGQAGIYINSYSDAWSGVSSIMLPGMAWFVAADIDTTTNCIYFLTQQSSDFHLIRYNMNDNSFETLPDPPLAASASIYHCDMSFNHFDNNLYLIAPILYEGEIYKFNGLAWENIASDFLNQSPATLIGVKSTITQDNYLLFNYSYHISGAKIIGTKKLLCSGTTISTVIPEVTLPDAVIHWLDISINPINNYIINTYGDNYAVTNFSYFDGSNNQAMNYNFEIGDHHNLEHDQYGRLYWTHFNQSLEVYTIGNYTSAINEISPSTEISFYPNPSHDGRVYSSLNFDGTYQVYSIKGELVLSGEKISKEIPIDLSSLKNGTYLIVLTTSDGFKMNAKFSVLK